MTNILANAAAAPISPHRARKRHLKTGELTPIEQRFVEALLSGANSASAAYTTASGVKGKAARVGGSRLMTRPEVQAALVAESRRDAAIGTVIAGKVLNKLMLSAKSDYVKADIAKYRTSAAGLGPRADSDPVGKASVIININLGPIESAPSAQSIDVTPQDVER